MKTTVLIFLLLCCFDLIPCYAQVNIVTNGSFEQGCGTNDIIVDGCPTFSGSCLPVWKPSHGTHQRSGYIRAGSNIITSGNTTPVMVHPAINTALYSGTQVLLMDNFLSAPNIEQFFVAEIKNECLCTQTFDLGLRIQSSYPDNYAKEDAGLMLQNKKTAQGIPVVLPYPNETHYLARRSSVLRSVEVIDLFGRVLYRENISENEVIVNLSAFSDGIYIIRLMDSDGRVFPEKIRCQH